METQISKQKEMETQNSHIRIEEHNKIIEEKLKTYNKEKEITECTIQTLKKESENARISNTQKSKEISELYNKIEEAKQKESKMINEIEDLKSQSEVIRKQLQAEIKDIKKLLPEKKEECKKEQTDKIEDRLKTHNKLSEKDKTLIEKMAVKVEELNMENHSLKTQLTKSSTELNYLKENAISKVGLIMYYAHQHIDEHRYEFENAKIDDPQLLAKNKSLSSKEKDSIIEDLMKEAQMLRQNLDILNIEVNKMAKSAKK